MTQLGGDNDNNDDIEGVVVGLFVRLHLMPATFNPARQGQGKAEMRQRTNLKWHRANSALCNKYYGSYIAHKTF